MPSTLILMALALSASFAFAAPTRSPHYPGVISIILPLVRGDLPAMREALRVSVLDTKLPGKDKKHPGHAAVRETALRLRAAATLDEAVKEAAALSLACGSCHAEHDRQVHFVTPKRPAHGSGIKDHMQHHLWATERMWESLAGPSDVAWSASLAELAEAVVESEGNVPIPDAGVALDGRVHELAASGLLLDGQEGRAGLHAELLVTCGRCHALLGKGPTAAP